MTSQEFEKELQKLDSRFSVVDNPNCPGLSNIFFSGLNYDLPVISTFDIREEVDLAYRYEFANGHQARFWTQSEVIGRIQDFLKKMKSGQLNNYHAED